MNDKEPTSEEWLEFAARAEQTMRDVGLFDPAYEHFVKERNYALNQAVEAEKKERINK